MLGCMASTNNFRLTLSKIPILRTISLGQNYLVDTKKSVQSKSLVKVINQFEKKTECRVTLIQLQGLAKTMYACAQPANLDNYSQESNHVFECYVHHYLPNWKLELFGQT